MNEREKIIRLWFDMWIKKADLGIDNIFTDDVVYTCLLYTLTLPTCSYLPVCINVSWNSSSPDEWFCKRK